MINSMQSQEQRPPGFFPIRLTLILILAFCLRGLFAASFPVNQEEVKTVMASTGWAVDAWSIVRGKELLQPSEVRLFFEFTPAKGAVDTVRSAFLVDYKPPAYHLLLRCWSCLAGSSSFGLRLFSVLCSTASVFLLFLIGRRLFDEKTGLLAALLLAISAYGVRFGVILRPYPLTMFLSLLSTVLVLDLAKENQFRLRSLKTAGLVLVTVTGLYAFYHYAVVFLFQLILLGIVFRSRPERKRLLGVAVICFLLWSPVIFFILTVYREHLLHRRDYFFGEGDVIKFLMDQASIHFVGRSWAGRWQGAWISVYNAVVQVVFYGLVSLGCRRSWRAEGIPRAFLNSVWVALFCFFVFDSLAGTHMIMIMKHWFMIVPFFLLFFSAGLNTLNGRGRGLVWLITFLMIFPLADVYAKGFRWPIELSRLHSGISTAFNVVEQKGGRPEETILLFNAKNINQVMPVLINSEKKSDVAFGAHDAVSGDTPNLLPGWQKYRFIIFVVFSNQRNARPVYSRQQWEQVVKNLGRNGFTRQEWPLGTYEEKESAVFLFSRVILNEGSPEQPGES